MPRRGDAVPACRPCVACAIVFLLVALAVGAADQRKALQKDQFSAARRVVEGAQGVRRGRRLLGSSAAAGTRVVGATATSARVGIHPPELMSRTVLLVNGSADDSFSFSFIPPPGTKFPDYDVRLASSQQNVLQPTTDVELSFTESGPAINISCAVDFHAFPGTVSLALEFWRTKENKFFDSITVNYVAAGLAFYSVASSGARKILSGLNRSLDIPDYETLLQSNFVQLGVFVQFLNGSDSDTPPASTKAENAGILFGIEAIQATFWSNRGIVLWDAEFCKLNFAQWDGTAVSLHDGCGAGLAMGRTTGISYDGFHFALKFERYRAGEFGLLLEWEQFTSGSEFEDEVYMSYLQITIGGTPPAVVRLVYPANEFPSQGNTTLYLEMFNTENAEITGFSVAGVDRPFPVIPGSHMQYTGSSGCYETVKFRTLPGTGKNLEWTVNLIRKTQHVDATTGTPVVENVRVLDLTAFLFSYDNLELVLDSIMPSVARDVGGDILTLSGSFIGFDPLSTGQILFSNMPIDSKLVRSSDNSTITISAPPRRSIGHAWAYSVQLMMGSETSRSQRLVYAATSIYLEPEVSGASYIEATGAYAVGPCSVLTVLAQAGIYLNFLYSWSLTTSDGIDILSEGNATSVVRTESSIFIPSKYLSIVDAVYTLRLEVKGPFAEANWSAELVRVGYPVIGVTILKLSNRTVSQPKVGLRVISKIELPSCMPPADMLIYEWDYENKTATIEKYILQGLPKPDVYAANVVPKFSRYVFSVTNTSGAADGDIGPVRLGRELVVARPQLKHGFIRIRLRVYIPLLPTLSPGLDSDDTMNGTTDLDSHHVIDGVGTATVTIGAEPLVAIIGAGESTRTVPDGADLLISASRSYDPDAAVQALSAGPDLLSRRLSYFWTCEISRFPSMRGSTSCDDNLLPLHQTILSEFLVPRTGLVSATSSREPDAEYVYVRYSLNVSTDERSSSTYQDIWVYPGTDAILRASVNITNGIGQEIDATSIPYWEEVIISPVVARPLEATIDAAWMFDLISPRHLRLSLFSGNSLLSGPGYYLPSGPSNNQFQSAPLGIQAGALLPHQEYVFSVTFLSQGASGRSNRTSITLILITVEKPNIWFPAILTPNVTVFDIVRANAYVDLDNDQMFKYQFYLSNLDGGKSAMYEYCLDGCTGAYEVRFSIVEPGHYRLQARLFAANGKALLAYADNIATIMAVDPTVVLSTQARFGRTYDHDSNMVYDFMLGNDGAVSHRAFWVTKSMIESSAESPVDDPSCAETISAWVNITYNIVTKELPITTNMRNYIDIATNYAQIRCIEEDETTMYGLLNIIVLVLKKTPAENTLQMTPNTDQMGNAPSTPQAPNVDVVSSLQKFYNYSISRALNGVAGHSTRSRLQPVPNTVNNLILDLFERWRDHMTTVASSAQACGWRRTIRSDILGGYPEYDLVPAFSGVEPPLGLNQITVAVRCNPENGMSIDGKFSRFEWCQSTYGSIGTSRTPKRLLVSLAEMTDYVFLSGIQGRNKTDTKRLVAIDISSLGSSNELVSTPPVKGIVLRSILGQDASTLCYVLGTEMIPLVGSSGSSNRAAQGSPGVNNRAGQDPVLAPTSSPQPPENFSSINILTVNSASPYNLWPLKKYGQAFLSPFESGAYARHTINVFAVANAALTNSSYITMTTSRLGLFGAVHQSRPLNSLALPHNIAGLAVSLFIIIIIMSLLLIAVTLLIYLLASAVLEAPTADPASEIFIERDYFGRGAIRLKEGNPTSDDESESGASE